MVSYSRGATPEEVEAEARVRSPRLDPEQALRDRLEETRSSKGDGLSIQICRRTEPGTMPYMAYYMCGDDNQFGHGTTPYMAVLDLINSHNTTEEWNRQNGK